VKAKYSLTYGRPTNSFPFGFSSLINTTKLECTLLGLPRSKMNETKYSRNIENDVEDADLVHIEEPTLSELVTSSGCLLVRGNNTATFNFSNTMTTSVEVNFELQRNHWERLKKEKFMMFVMRIVVNDCYAGNVRIYAQKTTPHALSVAPHETTMDLVSISERVLHKKVVYVEDTSSLSSPESDSLSDYERRGEKRRYVDDFVIDTSPLPQELIRLWSNAEGLRMFLSAVTMQSFCGEYMRSNSFDVQFSEKRIKV